MKTKLPIFLVFLLSTSFLYAQQFERTTDKKLNPDIKIYESGKQENIYIPARAKTKSSKESTAVFEITYTGFSEDAKAAFQAAADIWSNLISSPVPITIDAHWEVMESGVLGSSGSPELFKNFKNAPFKDTWYKPTVANRLVGVDLNPDDFDMVITYSSTANWYLGTDGNARFQTDFVSVVLHEIGHGLGFAGGAWRSNDLTLGGIGYTDGGDIRYPVAFDHFMYNVDQELLMDSTLFENPSAELLSEFTSNDVFFDSPLSNEANGGTPVELYAPSTWSGGSSISHLGEIYNNTEHALMTYAIGTGEAEHDPGSITMGIFAEYGWVGTRFMHDQFIDIETWSEPLTVNAEIFADTALADNSVFLHYSIDNFDTETKVSMTTLNDTLFTYDIPVLADDTVWYYIEAKSKLDRYYFYPSQGEGSIDASFIGNAFYFINGPDNIDPVLVYEQEITDIFNFAQTFEIAVNADDNIGIDSVLVEYKINDNAVKSLKIPFVSNSPTDLPKYEINISLLGETLNDMDTLFYKIVAIDSSSNTNSSTLPESGYYEILIHEIYAAETSTIINFNETVDENKFLFNGFTVSQPTDFDSKGLHSPHPYDAGGDYENNEIEYTATLKLPIILGESTKIRFEEVVIVEPGSGVPYGEDDFWDYVIIQGSKDSGKTWHDFADGYDSSIDPSFTSAFNNENDGSESMYLWHTIGLLENENLIVGDEVLIRFKLWSDPAAIGWGWAIDNISIQNDIEAPTAPTSLATTEITSASISLIWSSSTDNFEVEDYLLYKDDVLIKELSDTIYGVTRLEELIVYSFYVKARDIFGNISEASDTIYPKTDSSVGIEDIEDNAKHIKVYPNPATGYFNIEFKSEEIINELNISIYSIDGKLVYSNNKLINDNFIEEQINVKNMNTGIYIIKLNTGKNIITERLLIK
ncbi:MAG: T9SS type A sorting domain-containing protein [Bacteroidales bacterium]|nr:T9SS type A sorting domain-containing protein [Bacteroidales bacterium]